VVVRRALGEAEKRAGEPGVHSTVVAVDPRHWEVVRLTLWEHAASEADAVRYELLHLSTPHLDEIPVGRHWG
jgi:hypothetical protein